MAVTSIDWDRPPPPDNIFQPLGDDIHVLRGQKSRRLDNLLRLFVPGDSFLANDETKKTANGVTKVEFLPIFPFTAAHGVSVDVDTGIVTAEPNEPANKFPRNFLIRATVSRTGLSQLVRLIRVHVHKTVTPFLTPNALTLRKEPAGVAATKVGFSVFAEFDDGVFGDITRFGDPSVPASLITWEALTPDLISIDANGMITAKTDSGTGRVKVKLPAELGGGSTEAQVLLAEGWSTKRTATLLTGSAGLARKDEVPNFLILPDGFLPAEQAKFESLVRNLFKQWKTSETTVPFNLVPMNVFSLWVPSLEKGSTNRNLLRYLTRTPGKKRAAALKQTSFAPPVGQNPRAGDVLQLIYQVGLPTPAEASVPYDAKVGEWSALYGAAHVGNLDPNVYNEWIDRADYTLAFERDTAFGLASGDPPQAATQDDGRAMYWHPRRTRRADVDKMLATLVHGGGTTGLPETPIGAIWGTGTKDRTLVTFLTAGGRYSGRRMSATGNEGVASSLDNRPETLLTDGPPGRHIPEHKAYPLPDKIRWGTLARVTHESGHAFSLGDEYGGLPDITNAPDRSAIRERYANLQDAADVSDAAGIEGSLILWGKWPRIRAAGLVTAAITGTGPDYTVTVSSGHGRFFSDGDLVRLRKRPFYGKVGSPPNVHLDYLAESIKLRIKVGGISPNPAGDQIQVTVDGGVGTITIADWPPKKAILFAPRDTFMVHQKVIQYINTAHRPLNRESTGSGGAACVADPFFRQRMKATIPGIRTDIPRYGAWIVGLNDGGREYHCGIFHPRGVCLMRAQQVPKSESSINVGVIYKFCPVCRYILVDLLDPSLHGEMDEQYEEIYPVDL
jgi:hypothetical protein